MKKKWMAGVAPVVALCGSVGCYHATNAQGAARTAQKVVLTFWKEPYAENNNDQQMNEKFIKEFETENPNIQVNYLQLSWSDAYQKMTAAFASNNPPDITYQGDIWLDGFAAQHALMPLDGLPGAKALFANDYPAFIKSATYDGQRYGIPYDADFWPLILNKQIWSKAGKPTLPQTYAQLADFARKLTFDVRGKHPGQPGFDKKHIATYGIMQADNWNISVNYLYNYLWSFGSDYMNKDGTDIGFNNPQGQAALGWLKNLIDEGVATPPNLYGTNYNNWVNAQAKGKIAIEWGQGITPGMMQANPKFQYMILPAPAGPKGIHALLGGAYYLSISAKSKHPVEALKFIQFMIRQDNISAWLRDSAFFPVRPMPSNLYKGIGVNEQFMNEATPEEKYVHPFHLGLKYSPDATIIGEIDNYLDGRTDFKSMASNASNQIQIAAGNAGQ